MSYNILFIMLFGTEKFLAIFMEGTVLSIKLIQKGNDFNENVYSYKICIKLIFCKALINFKK